MSAFSNDAADAVHSIPDDDDTTGNVLLAGVPAESPTLAAFAEVELDLTVHLPTCHPPITDE